jgi:ankyrin repeat protein
MQVILAQHDVNVNAVNAYGQTALSVAAGVGQEKTVDLLLARDDIDVNVEDSHGSTALGHAAMEGHLAVVMQLLARDDIDLMSAGPTTLHLAVGGGHQQVVKLLLEGGSIDVNAEVSGVSALGHAALRGDVEMAELLLSHQDIVLDVADGGHEPFSLEGYRKIMELIRIKRGCVRWYSDIPQCIISLLLLPLPKNLPCPHLLLPMNLLMKLRMRTRGILPILPKNNYLTLLFLFPFLVLLLLLPFVKI